MPTKASEDSIDKIVALYKRDLDITLLETNLRLTVDERIAQLQRLLQFACELERAPRLDTTAK